jgi:predicted Zn finger-like uncharacterized protein
MSLIIDCPSCQRKLRVPDTLLGHSVKCPTCTTTFTAQSSPASDSAPPPAPAAPPAPSLPVPSERIVTSPEGAPSTQARCPSCGEAVTPEATRCRHCGHALTEEEDFETRRARRDAEPHRGAMVLVLGILSVVFAIVGSLFGLVVGPCAFLAFISIPLGIVAWILGQRDLAKMRANQMDREGEGQTRAGWICGIVGTSIGGLMSVCCLAVIVLYAGLFATMAASSTKQATTPVQPAPNPPRR